MCKPAREVAACSLLWVARQQEREEQLPAPEMGRVYGKIARVGRGGAQLFAGTFYLYFDVAALEFKLGDVLFDQKFYEFFKLFLIHC